MTEKVKKPKGFQKGVVSNPYGAKGKNAKVLEKKRESKEKLMASMALVLEKPMDEVRRMAKANNSRGSDALMAAVLVRGVDNGNAIHAQFFMNYTFGRPIDFDPKEDPAQGPTSEVLKDVPKEIIIKVLSEVLRGRSTEPAPVPA